MTKLCAVVVFVVVLVCEGVAQTQNSAGSQLSPAQTQVAGQKYAPGRVLVRFRPYAGGQVMAAVHAQTGAKVARTFRQIEGLQLVELPPGMRVSDAVQRYRENPDVLYAEPDFVVRVMVTPDDPLYIGLWGMVDIGAPDAWGITTGSTSVVVGVIDTGTDYLHPDLSANIYRNEADCDADGVDDDGNGYVDDCYGIDTFNGDSDPMDDNGHGTHVSGTIGARGNNGVGVAGVNWEVKIYPCKFLGADGAGYTSGAIACLDYFAAMKDRGVGIVATNNSWGSPGINVIASSASLEDAIRLQRDKGILFIVAAGNANRNNDVYRPVPAALGLENIVSVAAIDSSDLKASFSSYGKHTVHLGAPGVSILSTIPGNAYGAKSGTSMATPHVTGAAALLRAADPTRDWIEIRNLILTGAEPTASIGSDTITGGRLNLYQSLTCSGRTLSARLSPTSDLLTTIAGQEIDLSALHLNCADAAGAPVVTVTPGGTNITLADDGIAPDGVAGDGTYSGSWTVPAAGSYGLAFPGADNVPVKALIPYSYTSSTSAASYRDISSTGVSLNLDDESAAVITPGFPVHFGGQTFDQITVGSNGVVGFGAIANLFTDYSLPTDVDDTIVAPFWDDLMPIAGSAKNVYWTVEGTAPHRHAVIEWRNVVHWEETPDANATVTFQAVMFEGIDDVLFNYKDVYFGGSASGYADAGAAASVGMQIAEISAKVYSYHTASLSNDLSIHWRTGDNPVPVLDSVQPTYVSGGGTSGLTLTARGSFVPEAQIGWNGVPRTTSMIDSGTLTTEIGAAEVGIPGTVPITVVHGAPGGGSSAPQTFTITGFTVGTTGESSVTVNAGQSATYTIVVGHDLGNFDNWVALTCASGLPAKSSCSFSQSQVKPGGGAPQTTLNIATTAPTSAAVKHEMAWPFYAAFVLAPLGIVAAVSRKRRPTARGACGVLSIALAVAAMQSCGGGGSSAPPPPRIPGTPAGTYTITVQATSGSLTKTTPLTLTVK